MKYEKLKLYLIVTIVTNIFLLFGLLFLLIILDNYLNEFIIPISFKTHLVTHLAARWLLLAIQATPVLLIALWLNQLLLARLNVQYSRLIIGILLVIVFLINSLYILRLYSNLIKQI